jgi:hypothetical protein
VEKRNPKIWPKLTTHRRDDKHRYVWCPYYDKCLNEAVENCWPSFTCYYCPTNPLGKRQEKDVKPNGIDSLPGRQEEEEEEEKIKEVTADERSN